MKVLSEIFAILRIGGRQLDGLLVEIQSVIDHFGLAQEVGDLRRGDRVVGLRHQEPAPDCRGSRLAIGQGTGCVAQDQCPPVAEGVRIIGVGLVEQLVLRGRLGIFLILVKLGDQSLPQVAPGGG